MVAEEKADALRPPGGRGPQGARHVPRGVGADVAQGILRPREDDGPVKADEGVREGRARIAHGVRAVKHHEGVGLLAVGAQIVDDRLPRFGRGVRGVDERLELRQAHPPLELGPRDQRVEPSLEVGAGDEAVGRVDHADGSARVRHVYAHFFLPRSLCTSNNPSRGRLAFCRRLSVRRRSKGPGRRRRRPLCRERGREGRRPPARERNASRLPSLRPPARRARASTGLRSS